MGRQPHRRAPARRPGRPATGGSRGIVALLTVAVVAAAFAVAWVNRADLQRFADDVIRPGPASARPAPSAGGPGTRSGGGISTAEQAAPPLFTPGPVDVQVDGFMSWALLDRRTGAMTGSDNMAGSTNTTESMIKAWIASDFLRLRGNSQVSQSALDELSRMIRDSDDSAAEDIYRADGVDAVVTRMIKICGLTGTSIFSEWWSRTRITAQDAVRVGACIADGRAAGPKWTNWILGEMRQVRGEGRFGIIDALPPDAAASTSIKNGWTQIGDDGSWHVNCMAIVDRWVLAVLTRYPTGEGLDYGADVCQQVTTQLQPA